ncbi:putative Alpha/beta hydrolase fold-1 [Seiridium cardinale]
MASSDLPTIVFAPGAWHQPSCFDIVRDDLTSRGYETEAIAYPSVGAEPPNKGLADDAAVVRAALERLADQGKQIVLVVHSYGGMVGGNAVENLGYKQRAQAGKKGGVVMFVYMAAFANPKGLSGDLGKESGYVSIGDMDFMYHDVEPELRKKAIADVRHQSSPVFSGAATYEPWKEIDCTYLFCEDDVAMPIAFQEQAASKFPPSTLKIRLKASHSPYLSKPKETVDALIEAVKVGQEKVGA